MCSPMADIQNGPDKATGAMAVLVAMLYERYKAGKYPIALVSMDNCSQARAPHGAGADGRKPGQFYSCCSKD